MAPQQRPHRLLSSLVPEEQCLVALWEKALLSVERIHLVDVEKEQHKPVLPKFSHLDEPLQDGWMLHIPFWPKSLPAEIPDCDTPAGVDILGTAAWSSVDGIPCAAWSSVASLAGWETVPVQVLGVPTVLVAALQTQEVLQEVAAKEGDVPSPRPPIPWDIVMDLDLLVHQQHLVEVAPLRNHT